MSREEKNGNNMEPDTHQEKSDLESDQAGSLVEGWDEGNFAKVTKKTEIYKNRTTGVIMR